MNKFEYVAGGFYASDDDVHVVHMYYTTDPAKANAKTAYGASVTIHRLPPILAASTEALEPTTTMLTLRKTFTTLQHCHGKHLDRALYIQHLSAIVLAETELAKVETHRRFNVTVQTPTGGQIGSKQWILYSARSTVKMEEDLPETPSLSTKMARSALHSNSTYVKRAERPYLYLQDSQSGKAYKLLVIDFEATEDSEVVESGIDDA